LWHVGSLLADPVRVDHIGVELVKNKVAYETASKLHHQRTEDQREVERTFYDSTIYYKNDK